MWHNTLRVAPLAARPARAHRYADFNDDPSFLCVCTYAGAMYKVIFKREFYFYIIECCWCRNRRYVIIKIIVSIKQLRMMRRSHKVYSFYYFIYLYIIICCYVVLLPCAMCTWQQIYLFISKELYWYKYLVSQIEQSSEQSVNIPISISN